MPPPPTPPEPGGTIDPTRLRAERDELSARVRSGALAPLALLPRFSEAADALLADLLEFATGGDPTNCALVAVGGYGRRQLCPGSDLDVVLVHLKRRDISTIADRVWYAIWDSGIRLDHSVRTPKEAVKVATNDLTAMLGLLDGRVVTGDAAAAAGLLDEISQLWRAHARRFLPALTEVCRERGVQFGEVPFLLEPDLKEARGGLRDLDALSAAARALPVLAANIYPDALSAPGELLLATRSALQSLTGSYSDRLLLQDQDQVALLLGYSDADELMAAISEAGREVLWSADDAWRRISSQMAGPRGRGGGRDVPLESGLVLRDGEVALSPDARPAQDPALTWRLAAVAAGAGAPIARAALDRLVDEAPAPAGIWPREALDWFLDLLGRGAGAIAVLEALDQRRLIERHLPEWSAVRNRPQRNAFHRYTVDRHLLEAVARAAPLVREVGRPDLLLLGALFHDIGKGYPGDHSVVGSEVAETVGRRMGLEPADVEVLGRLVALHLLLPDTATRRDLDDPATIELVAKSAGNRNTLELLGALAEADGLATGSSAWSPWKAGLVRELVQRAGRLLAGETPPDRLAGYPTPTQRALLDAGRLAVRGDGSSVTVVAPDRPALLATVAGVLSLHRMQIRRAVVLPGDHGMALEAFDVAVAQGHTPDWAGIERDLEQALSGELLLEARLSSLRAAYASSRRAASPNPVELRVLVDNDASATATVLEVRAPDDTGLLHRLTLAIASAGLDVVSALVSTTGHAVVDSFYVCDDRGAKLVDGERLRAVTAALEMAATTPG